MADDYSDDRSKRAVISERIGHRFNNFRTTQVMTPIVVVVLLVAGLITLLTYSLRELQEKRLFLPENSLPILLIVGTISLLLALSAVVVIYARLDLTRWQSALGLPEGSIRAVIALLLIVLFFITAVFLYADVSRPQSMRRLESIDETRLAAIPTDQIQELVQVSTTPARYDVSLRTEKNAESKDIAKQLVTTVSTLVVAIAAFYFGSNSVQQAIDATKAPHDPKPHTPDPPPEPSPVPVEEVDATADSTELVVATTADHGEIPDTSAKVTQQHAPVKGAPT